MTQDKIQEGSSDPVDAEVIEQPSQTPQPDQPTDQPLDQSMAAPAVAASPGLAVGQQNSGKGLGVLAILMSLLALAAAAYAWYQTAVSARLAGGEQGYKLEAMAEKVSNFEDNQSGLNDQIAGLETRVTQEFSQIKQLVSTSESGVIAQISDAKQLITQSESTAAEQIRTIRGDVEAKIRDFRDEFTQLSGSLTDLKTEASVGVEGWTLREVEHLMLIANQQLELLQDVQGASQALLLAEQRLSRLKNPALLKVRQALSAEIAALGGVEGADVVEVSNALTILANTLDTLPILGADEVSGPAPVEGAEKASEGSEAGSTGEKIADIGRSFFADLGALVQVERGGKPVSFDITPELKQMILTKRKLVLEAAQVALMRQQTEIFSDRLNAAEAWVNEKFDVGNQGTIRWLEQLASLKQATPQVDYPDISTSLTALRNVLKTPGSEG